MSTPGPNVQQTAPEQAPTADHEAHGSNEKQAPCTFQHVSRHDFPHEEQTSEVRSSNVHNVHGDSKTAETQRTPDIPHPIQQCDCGHVARIHGPTPSGPLITATECRACTCRTFTAALDQPDYSQALTERPKKRTKRTPRKEPKNG